MKSKGALESSASIQMIVSFAVIGTAILLVVNFTGIIGVTGGEQQDRDQIAELNQKIKGKCQDSTTANPATVATGHDLNLRTYETIRYDGEDGELVAVKSGDDNVNFDLTGCNYEFEGFPVEKSESSTWSFEITTSDSESVPPTILVSATS